MSGLRPALRILLVSFVASNRHIFFSLCEPTWMLLLRMQPENIMCLSRTGNRIKIIDFGLARHYDPGVETRVMFGTPEFMAPEVVRFDPIDFSTDMWSVGVICYVL